jgi:hypothetical protein
MSQEASTKETLKQSKLFQQEKRILYYIFYTNEEFSKTINTQDIYVYTNLVICLWFI